MNNQRLAQLLNIEHPIIQAPMAGTSTPQMVAAASNAGALGSHGAASNSPQALREFIRTTRELTNKPFNINLFHHSTEQLFTNQQLSPHHKAQLEQYHHEQELGEVPEPKVLFGPAQQQLDVLIEEKVPVISFHFGVDAATVKKAKTNGAVVMCTATTLSEAKLLERAGIDVIIAQGCEAGGHQGSFAADKPALIGLMALLPQIVDAVSIPVVAAGGVMDARGVVACQALGAEGVQLGTAFLGCVETNLNPTWLSHLQQANADDTAIINVISGKPARGLRNRYVNEVESIKEPLLPYSAQYSVSAKLRQHALSTNNADFMVMWSGQGVGLFTQQTTAELINELSQGSQALLKQLNQ